jgi:hypothetical protein
VVVLLFSAIAATAQEKPDFPGVWMLVNPSNASLDAARSIIVLQRVDHRAMPPS